jgi:hypothetical protein
LLPIDGLVANGERVNDEYDAKHKNHSIRRHWKLVAKQIECFAQGDEDLDLSQEKTTTTTTTNTDELLKRQMCSFTGL